MTAVASVMSVGLSLPLPAILIISGFEKRNAAEAMAARMTKMIEMMMNFFISACLLY